MHRDTSHEPYVSDKSDSKTQGKSSDWVKCVAAASTLETYFNVTQFPFDRLKAIRMSDGERDRGAWERLTPRADAVPRVHTIVVFVG